MPLTMSRPTAVSSPAIVWLGTPESTDPTIVGLKAARLSALAPFQNVPPGFTITAQALRGLPLDEPLPAPLRADIAAAYRALAASGDGHTPEVVVRASSIEPGASAGKQGRSRLNVVGEDAVIEAVEDCRASAAAWSARGFGQAGDFAVLVQQMLRADVSAILFSANPFTGDADEAVIIANWGLGESLVNGSVTPDSWVVDRASGLIVEQHVGTKLRMTVADIEGVREVDVTSALRYLPTLTTRQVRELVRLASSLEARMGWPVEVKCAFRGDRLYLLRCRPLATLASSTLAA